MALFRLRFCAGCAMGLQPREIADSEERLNVNQQRRREKNPTGIAAQGQSQRAISQQRAVTHGQRRGALLNPQRTSPIGGQMTSTACKLRAGRRMTLPDVFQRRREAELPRFFLSLPDCASCSVASTRAARPWRAFAASRAKTRSTDSFS